MSSSTRSSASRRRDKPQLSCHLCRRHKSKCDRQQPCGRCKSRDFPCTYADKIQRPKLSPAAASERLAQLEALVVTLMRTPTQNNVNNGLTGLSMVIDSIDSTSTTIDDKSDCGSMSVTPSEHRYVGGDHWAAILDKIADLKEHFDQEELNVFDNSYTFQDNSVTENKIELGSRMPHALLLYRSRRSQTDSREDILNALPARSTVDRYISPAVHGPSFLNQYEAFWTDPSETPVVWIGLLFSMICLAVLASNPSDFMHSHEEEEEQSLLIDLYREKIVQCLNMGEYTQSGPFVLETLINYTYVEFGIQTDANKDVWFLLALEVNLAMRMGYHRDPRHFPGISPLQGEMRRRMWATVLLSDILISSQMGMSRMIKDGQWDTEEPRNLNDTDLSKLATTLPPARPETEHTTSLGVIARRRMLVALGIISDITDAVKPCTYAEVMRVDKLLHDAANSVPSPLAMKVISASVTDSPQVTMAKLFISHLFYKGQMRLHHRFLYLDSPASSASRSQAQSGYYSYSRKACLEASLGTFQIQHVLEEKTCPGGQLHSLRWRLTSSMNHLFLTATMILCSLLHKRQTMGREDEICAALKKTREVWIRRSGVSREAQKAAETVGHVLAEFREGNTCSSGYEATGGAHSIESESDRTPSTLNFNEHVTFHSSALFMTPSLVEDFPLTSKSQAQGFSLDFSIDESENDMGLNEWMSTIGAGTIW